MVLTADGSIFDVEELGLVVARDCGVRVLISWQHGQVSGQVGRSHSVFLWVPFDLNVV